MSFALSTAVVTAWLAAGPVTADAAAAGGHRHTVAAGHRGHSAWQYRHRFARQSSSPRYGYALPEGAMVMPGYVFVPGRGILDESCDLPTSACPNSERDIQ
jgi:hypothetical protein